MRRKLFTFISSLSLVLGFSAVALSEWNSAHLSQYGSGLRFSHGYFSLAYSGGHWNIAYLPPHGSYFYYRFSLWPFVLVTAALPLICMWRLDPKSRRAGTGKGVLWFLFLTLLFNGWLFASAVLAEHWASGDLGWWAILVAGISLIAWTATVLSLANRKTKLLRLKRGECLACGYSLTGNTSGACPECGAPIQ